MTKVSQWVLLLWDSLSGGPAQCRLWLFKVNVSTVQLFRVDCAELFINENGANCIILQILYKSVD
ncbi:MAG: hypothetical protein A3J25_07290 [Pseudomonadales bacterium RIFCSPLOWO2_02_FULL_63_210]|nr:MAG: hypothetical protein A3J25_07290 [Pseudomonadales bacterium RIFCSPLOWO2_02_FULL_63_210]